MSEAKAKRSQFLTAMVYAALLAGGFVASASETNVQLFGFKLPPLCSLKFVTGLDCPGCGLTRSIILALHGEFYRSYLLHLWGIPLLALGIAQIPVHILRGVLKSDQLFCWPAWPQRWTTLAVVCSLLIPWIAKGVIFSLILYIL